MVNVRGAQAGPQATSSTNGAQNAVEPIAMTPIVAALDWRCIGPHRGGRVVAVAGDPVDPMTFYFGACAGGVWKTTDGGAYWENVSDGFFKTAAVGAIAVADADPNVVYAGMGETCIRGNVSHGDGVYKSTDGGETWTHRGLSDTRHIARVRVHPRDPDLVYVAALGHAWGPNRERGIYRSRDGGQTWEQILYRDERTGAIDLSLDPHNPRILYAALWEAGRTPYSLVSGGPGSGLFKSTDGGDTWTEITNNPGLPEGVKGRIGVAVSPARPGRVWALVEAIDGALFRSDDGGATWQRLSEDGELRRRFWYYGHLFADPRNADTCWVLNVQCWKSIDGGSTFGLVATPHGDNHDLWIDPQHPLRMIEGNDGGACVSFNGGASWSSIYNQPTAQFYHVTTDTQFPYRIYGSQQDNSAIALPSRTTRGAITTADWYVPGGGESGYIAVRPDDPNIVFGGAIGSGPGDGLLYRYDHRTGQTRNITVWPEIKGMGAGAQDLKYRFQWTFPIELSPHDPTVLYVAGNHVFRSTDEGGSWEAISPDLTRNDVSKMAPSGGPITKDNTGAEHYGTIFALVESPHEPGVFWAGSDDGLIHLSRDGGQTWQNVTPPAALLPEWALISTIALSPHDPATAYVAATRYKLDDCRPYLLKTDDSGQTWQTIVNGIPDDDFTRVIREDPALRGLLYAGSETGVYISFDNGGQWQRLGGNLPIVPIHDLVIKDANLVLATHGRSFWILDDLTPLRELAANETAGPVRLFPPGPTYRLTGGRGGGYPLAPGKNFRRAGGLLVATFREERTRHGDTVQRHLDAGDNPPDGVVVAYTLTAPPQGPVRLTFKDAQGAAIITFASAPTTRQATAESPDRRQDVTGEDIELALAEGDEQPSPELAAATSDEAGAKDQLVPANVGFNRFVWNMRYPDAHPIAGDETMARLLAGPLAPPGHYQIELTVDGQTFSQPFELAPDPRLTTTPEEFADQFALLRQIGDKLSAVNDAVNQIRDLKQQTSDWSRRARRSAQAARIASAASALGDKFSTIEAELLHPDAAGPLGAPAKLASKLGTLALIVASADAPPTRQSCEVFASLSERADVQLATLRQALDTDVAAFNTLLREADVPLVGVAQG